MFCRKVHALYNNALKDYQGFDKLKQTLKDMLITWKRQMRSCQLESKISDADVHVTNCEKHVFALEILT